MKVLQAAKLFPPPFGGIETVLDALVHGLLEVNSTIDLSVLATHPSPDKQEELASGRLHIKRIKSVFQMARTPLAPAYARCLKAEMADLVHFHFPYPWAELSWLRCGLNTPAIATYHSDIVRQRFLGTVYRPLMNCFLGRMDRIVIASPHMRESSSVIASLPPEKVTVIPYGIPTANYAITSDSQSFASIWRSRLSGQEPLLLFVGRLVYYKGLPVLLKALRQVNARLAVVGEGPLRAEWEQCARDLGIADRVFWLGTLSADELRGLYQASDLFVLPSTEPSEAFGMVLLEAQASGVPVVSSDLPTGVTFINRHGVTGWTFPTGNSQALAESLRTLLADHELRGRLAEQARRRARTEFDTTTMVRNYFNLYTQVLEARAAGIKL